MVYLNEVMKNDVVKKIISRQQYKYMIYILLACIFHFIIEGLFFGFSYLLEVNSVLYYFQQILNIVIFFPLFMVLAVYLQEKFHIFFDGRKTIIYLVYMIPVGILMYLIFFIIGIVTEEVMMADVSMMLIAVPFVISYVREWYDYLFEEESKKNKK